MARITSARTEMSNDNSKTTAICSKLLSVSNVKIMFDIIAIASKYYHLLLTDNFHFRRGGC